MQDLPKALPRINDSGKRALLDYLGSAQAGWGKNVKRIQGLAAYCVQRFFELLAGSAGFTA